MAAPSPSPSPAGGGPRPGSPRRLAALYRQHLTRTGREERFLAWASFTVTFSVARFITHSIHAGRFPRLFHDLTGPGGRHLHHLVFGILGLLGGGYLTAASRPRRPRVRRGLAVLYGASAALTIDEFAFWSSLADVYWSEAGRVRVDTAILAGAVLAVGVEGRDLLAALWQDTQAHRARTGEPPSRSTPPARRRGPWR